MLNHTKHSFLTDVEVAVLEAYDKGSYIHLVTSENHEDFQIQLEGAGDGLLIFLMRELSAEEDCNDVEDAINRVLRSISQIQDVQYALLSM